MSFLCSEQNVSFLIFCQRVFRTDLGFRNRLDVFCCTSVGSIQGWRLGGTGAEAPTTSSIPPLALKILKIVPSQWTWMELERRGFINIFSLRSLSALWQYLPPSISSVAPSLVLSWQKFNITTVIKAMSSLVILKIGSLFAGKGPFCKIREFVYLILIFEWWRSLQLNPSVLVNLVKEIITIESEHWWWTRGSFAAIVKVACNYCSACALRLLSKYLLNDRTYDNLHFA